MSRKLLKVTLGLTVIAGMTLGAASVAFAEGQRLSSISGWEVGHRSKTWADSNGDSNSTKVMLTSVTLDQDGGNIVYHPTSVQLQLLKDNPPFGFQSVGNRTSAPGVYQNWGNPGSGTFEFQYNGATANGLFYGNQSGFSLYATHANIYW